MIGILLFLVLAIVVFFFLLGDGLANNFKGSAENLVYCIIAIIGGFIWLMILK